MIGKVKGGGKHAEKVKKAKKVKKSKKNSMHFSLMLDAKKGLKFLNITVKLIKEKNITV